ncbi:LamG domain-containing protein [Streptosporangiaceae bacterium NEAU-GS5]|nr:LamG domain-containing protein [Streptosporangiaceae bacterium NEAU-GS5]
MGVGSWTRVGSAVALLAAGLVLQPVPRSAAAPPPCGVAAPTQRGALVDAARCGRRIEDLSARTETDQVLANPDGTLTAIKALEPQRVRTRDGWRPIDTSLRFDADGGVVAGAITADVRFSGGGLAPLVTLGAPDAQVGLLAPWPLPTPVLSGDTATYPDVLPGVDLRLSATPAGFTQLLVVRTAQAAANPALERLRFRLDRRGASIRHNGDALEVVDGAGTVLFASGAALMWDTPVSTALPISEQVPHRVERMAVAATDTELTLTPALDMLRAADATFPMYIDPAFSKPNMGSNWTHVNECSPGTSYYTQYRAGMRVGNQWNTDCTWRTFMQFAIGEMSGSKIISAQFVATADHVAACDGADEQLWRASYISNMSAATWNSTKGSTFTLVGTKKFEANESSCPDPDDQQIFDEGAGGTLDGQLQSAVTAGNTTITYALRARYETDQYSWSYFLPGSIALQVTFNHTPSVPRTQQITTDCGSSCAASGAQVRSGTPTLQAIPDDPNGGTLSRVEFEVYDQATRATLKAASGTAVTNRAVDQAAPWQVTPALPQGAYSWRVRGCDAYLCGGYTSWFDFTVDTSPPTGLGASSAAYPAKSTGVWSGGSGQPGTFTITASGASKFELTLNGVNKGWSDATSADTWTGDVTPDRDGVNVLSMRAADLAGNLTTATYEFLVKPAATKSWVWGLNEGTGTSAASAPTGYPLALGAGTALWTQGRGGAGGALSLNGTAHWTTANPVIDTTASFTVTAWVRLSGLTAAPITAVSQDGASGSQFRLQYRTDLDVDGAAGADPAWCFAMFAADGGAETAACSTESAGTDWVHLTGTYDKANGRIRIFVGGLNFDDTDTKAFTSTWSAAGGWVIGGAKAVGARTQLWSGAVDRVAVYQKVLTASEISSDMAQA